MNFPVIRATAYVLVHAPDILMGHGTTITMERVKNPDSEYLKALPGHLRSFQEAVGYLPNQVYIGNAHPRQLTDHPSPWYQHPVEPRTQGRFGQILDQAEFYGLMKIADSFNLVELSAEFAASIKDKLPTANLSAKHFAQLDRTRDLQEIEEMVVSHQADGLYQDGQLVGCVREAHDTDPNLSAHVVFENLVCKASGVLALVNLLERFQIDPKEIDYIIETSEEAIGDMNQRGGGNLAKAIGEIGNCENASGADIRGFCAGPAHGILSAAALVRAGIFKNVVVLAGGSSAKLGMNSRDHVNKQMPVLEDMIGGYAILISENDGINPVIRTDIVGKHKIGSGSSPQAVIQAIVADPLERNGLKITDVDIFAPELQNPEITVPAGAGDVPLANYKMIGAMAVKRGELDKSELAQFTTSHGMTGFAPTQGHIPSGVPLLGVIREELLQGKIKRAMVIGKGSLFLGRMTDLFDGISLILEPNQGLSHGSELKLEDVKEQVRLILAEAMEQAAESLARR
ncbi:MAG TPA: glycine/sarcosine/betaine reductase complex component C subunit beta [Syntrophomonadaceae bacterium]|nr:glycine/sarcosine/betaine reductase complex component C subunit beta [Syntrophomonadaceae bacterium]HQE22981.1 glycine/sarcosine/betaine reductase complex component C subunit beta [Syntrophomonadaceae bacterium]